MSTTITDLLREVYGVDLGLTIEEMADGWSPARLSLFFEGVALMRHAASNTRLIYSDKTIGVYVGRFNDEVRQRARPFSPAPRAEVGSSQTSRGAAKRKLQRPP